MMIAVQVLDGTMRIAADDDRCSGLGWNNEDSI